MKPIRYWLRTLIPAKRSYDKSQRECLAMVWPVLLLHPYLERAKFVLRTDYHELEWILNLSNATRNLVRCRLRLPEFKFEVIHLAGIIHQVAHAL